MKQYHGYIEILDLAKYQQKGKRGNLIPRNRGNENKTEECFEQQKQSQACPETVNSNMYGHDQSP